MNFYTIGDKVICIDDQDFNPDIRGLFDEDVQKGHVYVVSGIRIDPDGFACIDLLGMIPKPMDDGTIPGYRPDRFAKLGRSTERKSSA